jgi:N,N'-diacetyllegionaminate synthase
MKFIAELCQNHNGDESLLYEMIQQAKYSGATHVKIQNLYSFELTKRQEFEQESVGRFQMYRPYELERERLSKLDLSEEQEAKFVEVCHDLEVIPVTTVFSSFGAVRARKAGFRHVKIASYSSTEIKLINEVLDFAESIIISTGATTINELYYLTKFLQECNVQSRVSLLHCKTEYPNQINRVHLRRMTWICDEFGLETGFSDHSPYLDENGDLNESRLLPAKVAIFLGAQVIEKHFTILHPSATKDGKISATPRDLRELVAFSQLDKRQQKSFLDSCPNETSLIIDEGNLNFDPSVEEWFNRRYYKGRVNVYGDRS